MDQSFLQRDELPSIPNFHCMSLDLYRQHTSKKNRNETAALRQRFLSNKRASQRERSKTAPIDASRKPPDVSRSKPRAPFVRGTNSKTSSAPNKSLNEQLSKEMFKRPEIERPPYHVKVNIDPRPAFDYPSRPCYSSGCFFSKVAAKTDNRNSQTVKDNTHLYIRNPTKHGHSEKSIARTFCPSRAGVIASSPLESKGRLQTSPNTNNNLEYIHMEVRGSKRKGKACDDAISESKTKANTSHHRTNPNIKMSEINRKLNLNNNKPHSCFRETSSSIQSRDLLSTIPINKSTPNMSWNESEKLILMELKRNKARGLEIKRGREIREDIIKVTPEMRYRNHFIHPEWSSESVGWARYAHPTNDYAFRFSWI